jgi:hypothetical protein
VWRPASAHLQLVVRLGTVQQMQQRRQQRQQQLVSLSPVMELLLLLLLHLQAADVGVVLVLVMRTVLATVVAHTRLLCGLTRSAASCTWSCPAPPLAAVHALLHQHWRRSSPRPVSVKRLQLQQAAALGVLALLQGLSACGAAAASWESTGLLCPSHDCCLEAWSSRQQWMMRWTGCLLLDTCAMTLQPASTPQRLHPQWSAAQQQ